MMGIGAFLLALGVADLVAGGLAGEPRSHRRAALGLVSGLAAVLLIAWAGAFSAPATWILVALTALGGGWLFLRVPPVSSSRIGWALGLLTGAVVATIGLSGALRPWPRSIFRVLETVDVPWVSSLGPSQIVLMGGTVVFLTASTNGVVRAVLGLAGTEIERSQQRLRGGRLIGAIERLLIYGLAVVGEPTAAALIVSAKSLLRFPELSKVARESDGDRERESPEKAVAVDHITEYFLLGSLVSWFVALASALLVLDPGG